MGIDKDNMITAVVAYGPHAGKSHTFPGFVDTMHIRREDVELSAKDRQGLYPTAADAARALVAQFEASDSYWVIPRPSGTILVPNAERIPVFFDEWKRAWGYTHYAMVVCVDEPPKSFGEGKGPFRKGDIRGIHIERPDLYVKRRAEELSNPGRWQNTLPIEEVDPAKIAEYWSQRNKIRD